MEKSAYTVDPLEASVRPVAYKVTAPDGVVVFLEKPLPFASHCTEPLYAIPEGWQLVPKEPTPEMVKAGNIGQGFSPQALKAAIAAAPLPPNVELTGNGATTAENK